MWSQDQSDNYNRMITITDQFFLIIISIWDLDMWLHYAADNINRVIRLNSFYCNMLQKSSIRKFRAVPRHFCQQPVRHATTAVEMATLGKNLGIVLPVLHLEGEHQFETIQMSLQCCFGNLILLIQY